MSHELELAAAQEWLDATDRIALEHFRVGVPTEAKADGTPVTVADRAIEERLRAAIARAFPADGILGEEAGEARGAGRRWIVDPIDGTKNYARGVPVFGTLLALEDEGRLVMGVVSSPALRTRWWATQGGGAYRDGSPIHVSNVSRLGDADVCTGDLRHASDAAVFHRLARSGKRWRGFGDFWGHVLVAQGSMDAMVELADLAEWDVAAPKLIVEEAGGRVTSPGGDASPPRGPLVSTNGLVHEEVLAVLGSD